jgi:putative acetyltransferase
VTVIRQAEGAADLAAVRALCRAYRDALIAVGPEMARIVATFYPPAAYEDLLDRLETVHARPRGAILLAVEAGRPLGCGMLQPLPDGAVELKRMFVDPSARGRGVARALFAALIAQARADGYGVMRFDTARALTGARAMYAALGCPERGPYQDMPAEFIPLLAFYEIDLETWA